MKFKFFGVTKLLKTVDLPRAIAQSDKREDSPPSHSASNRRYERRHSQPYSVRVITTQLVLRSLLSLHNSLGAYNY